MSPEPDSLHRFLIEGTDVRGELVHLDDTWQTLLARREYPPAVRDLLGEALSAVALLAATIKFEGSLSLQLSGSGPLSLLLVQAANDRSLRGLASWRGRVTGSSFEELVGGARLIMTIDSGPGKEQFQGIVDAAGRSIAEVLQHYFDHSEQLPTRLWLAADASRAAGLLLQKVPGRDGTAATWERMTTRSPAPEPRSLLGLSATDILAHLYGNEDVRLFRPEPVCFRCTCTRERIESILCSLGKVEVEDILSGQGVIATTCEFCGQGYRFDSIDVATMFAEEPALPLSDATH
jgi:molecular chaperone Hsp33